MPLSRYMTALVVLESAKDASRFFYFAAPKRLSNEFGGTIGAEPET